MAETPFTKATGIKYPIICGAMYPCSNPELVAAASAAGAMAIVQPVSLVFVHKQKFRDGLRQILDRTQYPIGLNLLVEKSSRTYQERNREWMGIALEEGVRFFITALGNPSWVVDQVHKQGGLVYHDVTEKKWAMKALDCGVDGLICVNNRAGGHAGQQAPEKLLADLKGFGKPLICAGGVGSPEEFRQAIDMGYDGVQMGTRFIATKECTAHEDYKRAILKAKEKDIVLTDKISGVPVSVIKTPYISAIGTKAGPLSRMLLKNSRTKHYMRMFYTLKSIWQLKQSYSKGNNYKEYYQAGKSVEHISALESAETVVKRFGEAWANPAATTEASPAASAESSS